MSDFDEMKLRRLDLTVMLVFLGLMEHRKALTVARRMGLTQSSISHALRRLRDLFGDELFLRRPHGLEPTDVAVALEPQIRRAVEVLDAALTPVRDFHPATARGTVTLACLDYEQATLLPDLLARIDREAPGLKVLTRSLGREGARAALAEGAIDLALGFFWEEDSATLTKSLFSDGYCVALRQDHPLAEGTMTRERYLSARHLLVAPGGSPVGIVDRVLEAEGLARDVRVSLPLFFPALAMLSRSDLIATLPHRLVAAFAPRFGLVARRVPFEVRPYRVMSARHARAAKSGLLDWIDAALLEIAAAPSP
jgi:DNA-binding transcriptional LysR family regulator